MIASNKFVGVGCSLAKPPFFWYYFFYLREKIEGIVMFRHERGRSLKSASCLSFGGRSVGLIAWNYRGVDASGKRDEDLGEEVGGEALVGEGCVWCGWMTLFFSLPRVAAGLCLRIFFFTLKGGSSFFSCRVWTPPLLVWSCGNSMLVSG